MTNLIHMELLPIGSYLIRIYSHGDYEHRDDYDISLVLVFHNDSIEIKGADKPITVFQRKLLRQELTKYNMPIWAERHGRRKEYK